MLEERSEVGGLLQHGRVGVCQQAVPVAPAIAVYVQHQAVAVEGLQRQRGACGCVDRENIIVCSWVHVCVWCVGGWQGARGAAPALTQMPTQACLQCAVFAAVLADWLYLHH